MISIVSPFFDRWQIILKIIFMLTTRQIWLSNSSSSCRDIQISSYFWGKVKTLAEIICSGHSSWSATSLHLSWDCWWQQQALAFEWVECIPVHLQELNNWLITYWVQLALNVKCTIDNMNIKMRSTSRCRMNIWMYGRTSTVEQCKLFHFGFSGDAMIVINQCWLWYGTCPHRWVLVYGGSVRDTKFDLPAWSCKIWLHSTGLAHARSISLDLQLGDFDLASGGHQLELFRHHTHKIL